MAPNVVPSLSCGFSGLTLVYGCAMDFQAPNVLLLFGPALNVTPWFALSGYGTKCDTMFWGWLPFVTLSFGYGTKCNNILARHHCSNLRSSLLQFGTRPNEWSPQ